MAAKRADPAICRLPSAMTRSEFLRAVAAGAVAALSPAAEAAALALSRRRADFTFTRLRYESGNWDVDQRMPANLLHSLIQYTTVLVDERERVVPLASTAVFDTPFSYLAGHKLVQFNRAERDHFARYVRTAALSGDDCNHDLDGLFARSFESQMAAIFGPEALRKLPNDHELYRAVFPFPEGPPTTALELNGWGDDLVHEYLKAIEIDGRIAVLYSNKDYGCEWDYDFRNGASRRTHEVRRQHRDVRDDRESADDRRHRERLAASPGPRCAPRSAASSWDGGGGRAADRLAGGHCLLEGVPGSPRR
jgi:hypothetical protein